MNFIYIAIGGAIGSVLRYLVSVLATTKLPNDFPYPILIVNIIGCIVMGILAGIFFRTSLPPEFRLFMATGVMGGFTTFSAFAVDSFMLMERGDYFQAAIYILASVIISLVGFAGGFYLVKMV